MIHAIRHAWSGYEKKAFGFDEVKPLSGGRNDWIGLGLTILDSLDGPTLERHSKPAWGARHLRANGAARSLCAASPTAMGLVRKILEWQILSRRRPFARRRALAI